MRRGRGTTVALATVVTAAALLAGCGGITDDAGSGAARDEAPAAAPEQAGAPNDKAAGAPGGGAADGNRPGGNRASGGAATAGKGALARVAPQLQQLIKKADVSVQVKDVQAAASKARQLVSAARGTVFAEQGSRSPDGADDTARIQITFKVPPDQFDSVVDGLGKLGTRLSTTVTTEDVTDQVVDVEARIRSQQESVNRVRALLARANSLGEVVQVESELTRRVADLEALESRQKALAAQVAQSTVTLHLSGPSTAATSDDDSGFMAGLGSGWRAFTASVEVALTVVGALLPFLVLIAVLWLPVRWAVRQLRRRLPQPSAPRLE